MGYGMNGMNGMGMNGMGMNGGEGIQILVNAVRPTLVLLQSALCS
jgi:hypothetical protein